MMRFVPFIKAVAFVAIAIILLALRGHYEALIPRYDLPEKFMFAIYRVAITFCFIECARLIVIFMYRLRGAMRRDNFTIGIGHISKILYGMLLVVLILSLFNLSVKEAATSLSLIAAAVALMTKDYISNLINGMYLTFTKVINVGDTVQIADYKGKILDITLTNVHLQNDDDDIIYIPNNKVFSNEIINYTRRQLKKSSIEFEIDVAFMPQTEELEKALIQSLTIHLELIQPNSFNLKVQSIKQEHISYKFQYILKDPLNKEHDKKVKRFLVRQVIFIIKQERKSVL